MLTIQSEVKSLFRWFRTLTNQVQSFSTYYWNHASVVTVYMQLIPTASYCNSPLRVTRGYSTPMIRATRWGVNMLKSRHDRFRRVILSLFSPQNDPSKPRMKLLKPLTRTAFQISSTMSNDDIWYIRCTGQKQSNLDDFCLWVRAKVSGNVMVFVNNTRCQCCLLPHTTTKFRDPSWLACQCTIITQLIET